MNPEWVFIHVLVLVSALFFFLRVAAARALDKTNRQFHEIARLKEQLDRAEDRVSTLKQLNDRLSTLALTADIRREDMRAKVKQLEEEVMSQRNRLTTLTRPVFDQYVLDAMPADGTAILTPALRDAVEDSVREDPDSATFLRVLSGSEAIRQSLKRLLKKGKVERAGYHTSQAQYWRRAVTVGHTTQQ